jgi:hypothetical protein
MLHLSNERVGQGPTLPLCYAPVSMKALYMGTTLSYRLMYGHEVCLRGVPCLRLRKHVLSIE